MRKNINTEISEGRNGGEDGALGSGGNGYRREELEKLAAHASLRSHALGVITEGGVANDENCGRIGTGPPVATVTAL